MYHCDLQIDLLGRDSGLWNTLRGLPPLEGFSHCVQIYEAPCPALAQADLVLADLRDVDAQSVLDLLGPAPGPELILLAQPGLPLPQDLSRVADIWPLPMPPQLLTFRFRRWQEHCKAQRDAWQTSQYLEATINSVPNLIWYKTRDGIHEKVNDSFCATVGKTKEQVQGQGHAYIWDVEQDDPACIESEAEVMRRRETCISEETIQTGEGTRLLTTYKSPLYDWDGSVMGTVGVAIDVTQERAYEKEIIEKNRSLERVFTTMDCGVMTHTLSGDRILSINRAALEILGYESEQQMMEAGFDMVASSVLDEDQARLRACIHDLQKVGDNVSIEYRVRHQDGRLMHVMGNVKLVEEDGELFYQRFLLDCTAQKLREEAERTAQERRQMAMVQALTIDYSLVCFFDLDSGTGFPLRVEASGRYPLEDIFTGKLVLEDCMEQYIRSCVYVDDQGLLRNAVSRETLARDLADRSTSYTNFRTFNGSQAEFFQFKAVRTGDWDDQHTIVLGLRSVDEETRREMEKKSLLEDALMQANRASRAKSVFLSNMSHDIRTPMNAIVGFTSLAIGHIDHKEQVEEYLKKIMTSGNHLLSLINDILDMSRIESGKIHLDEAPCSLPEILHSMRSIVQADIHAKQLELFVDAVDVIHEEVCCDKLRLNQILLNLMSNAIKYTPSGGKVTMRLTERGGAPAGFASYEFYIEDTGIGMSEEFVSRIFEPFERERNSTISGIQGTGLGMAITKNIVDLMHGAISVESKQGVGTRFIVRLTFRLSDARPTFQPLDELANCRALVVDDDYNTCDSVSYMLQQIGMRAEWTMSGKEAVLRTRQAASREDRYSVYIIDWLLPDMNGVEVARRVRKEVGENAPIIVMTAYDWSDIEDEAREAGVKAFCSKPLFLSELRQCLNAVVNVPLSKRKEAVPSVRHTGHILLAEDNVLNQEIAVAILEEAGFTVEVADNGEIALEMLRQAEPGHYHLILMDVQMPVMDGYTATKAIRSLEDRRLAKIPILAMTANAFEEDKQAALRCGMNGHIAKPIDIDNLISTLDGIFSE